MQIGSNTCPSRARRADEQQASKTHAPWGRSRREAEAGMNIQNRLVTADLTRRAEIVALIAARAADAVDRETKFPAEAIAAARAQRPLDRKSTRLNSSPI